jgi:hypothetical protein
LIQMGIKLAKGKEKKGKNTRKRMRVRRRKEYAGIESEKWLKQ